MITIKSEKTNKRIIVYEADYKCPKCGEGGSYTGMPKHYKFCVFCGATLILSNKVLGIEQEHNWVIKQ